MDQASRDALYAVLREKAEISRRSPNGQPWRKTHTMLGTGDDSVARRVGERLGTNSTSCSPDLRHEMQIWLQRAAALGHVVASHGTQAPGHNMDWLPFTFTEAGINFLLGGGVALEHEGALAQALQDLHARNSDAVTAGQLALLAEADRCWRHACYRAGMVLIGVANEESILNLLEALGNYPESSRLQNHSREWRDALNPTLGFVARFEPGVAILRRVARALRGEARIRRQAGAEVVWGNLWSQSIGSLHALGEAVRFARNSAAHDPAAEFRRSDVGLLLASMPLALEHIAELRAFMLNPPAGLTLPDA